MNDPLLFEPGTKTAYSTFGFTMLGAVAEAATGETFQALSRDFFRYSLVAFDIDDPLTIVPKRVRGYTVDKEGRLPTVGPMMRATSTLLVASPRLRKTISALQLLSVLDMC